MTQYTTVKKKLQDTICLSTLPSHFIYTEGLPSNDLCGPEERFASIVRVDLNSINGYRDVIRVKIRMNS